MTERLERLRHTLEELERELESLDAPLDQPTRQRLEQVREEIQTALHEEDVSLLEPQSLIERLKEAEQNFEVSHPTLSGVVLRMIHALGQIGI